MPSFDCGKCLSNCKADCCHQPVPFEKSFVESHRPVRQIMIRKELGSHMVSVLAFDERYAKRDEKGKKYETVVCPYLGFDDRCSVYDDRPEVCRKYGDESSMMMVCSFQSADGRIRSRQERRHIERVLFKRQYDMIKRLNTGEATAEDVEIAKKIARAWSDSDPAKKRALAGEEIY